MSVRFVKNPDAVLREEDDQGGLIYNPDTNEVKIVNSTGLFVWELCDGTKKIEELVSAVQDAYEVPKDQDLQADVNTFLTEMEELQFVGRLA